MPLTASTQPDCPQLQRPADQPGAGRTSMTDRAIRLWPDDERNRQEWLRAVDVVRSTQGGWLLDRHVGRARS